MENSIPPHSTNPVHEHLTSSFGNMCIGQRGPVRWPPQSPDLNPLDFYFSRHTKRLVYALAVSTVIDL